MACGEFDRKSVMFMIKCWFDYKTVIVTGASRGIGRGLVDRLINDHNCRVIGVARSEDKLLELKNELGDKGYRFSYKCFDVSVEENWKDFAQHLTESGIQPDVLINNAGILPRFDRFGHYTMDDITQAMDINFYSAVYSMHWLLPILLRAPDPGIVNVSSSAALCALAGTSVYSASKAALKSLTESIREEYRGRCYVGLVCPGFTKTEIFRNQDTSRGQKALDMVSTDCDYMVNKIVSGIWRKKSEMIIGIDAKFMYDGNRIGGVRVSQLSSFVLKITKLPMFANIYAEDDK